MRHTHLKIAAITLLLNPLDTQAQEPTPAPRTVPASKLQEDINILETIYTAAHPGLYRYNTRPQLESHYATLRAQFARDRTLAEAFILISQFLANIQCGHTYANFFNQPKSTADALFTGKNRVPFCFRWIDGKMIVTRNLSSNTTLNPGTEVLSINGIPTTKILTQLLTIARADGANTAKRVAYLEVQGTDKFQAFDIFLPLFFPTIGEQLSLEIRTPGTPQPTTIKVAAQDHTQRAALAKQNSEPQRNASDPLWQFRQLDPQTACWNMPTWALYNTKWDWQTFLDKNFDDLVTRKVPNLIIDLRNNEGGLDVGNALIARLTPAPIRADRYQRFTRYRAFPLPKSYDAYLDTWDWSFKDWGQSAIEDRLGFYRMTKFDDTEQGDVITPKAPRYEGRVVVLTSAVNSSATFQFAQLVKQHKLATLIGQPTGGNQRGINGGAFFFVTLPNSKIEVDLPLVATFIGEDRPNGTELPFQQIPNAGIDPDILITPSVKDIAAGIDSERQATRDFLQTN